MENPSKGHFMSQSYKSPLAKKGFEIAKPHLKAAASNIASNAVKHVMERFAGDQEMKQEGSGGIMVLSRRKRRRPPGERIPSSFNKQPFAITDGGPIEFFIPGDGDRYLDLNDTLLHLRVKITNANGSNLANDAAAVGLINYPLNTIFSQCDVTLGDRLISQSSATHPYRCMIETLLNFSPDTLSSQFTGGLFYKDTAGSVDSIVLVNGPNNGLTRRAASTARSREVHLLGPLHGDIFFCERLLLNSVDLRIKLTRANDAFCLMGARDSAFSLKVLGASLFVKKVAVSPAVREFYNMFLATGRHLKDLPLSISRDDFYDGYSLFVFNLNPSDDNDALSTVSNGNLRLELRFKPPAAHRDPYRLRLLRFYLLEINAKRQVLVDYY
ncbi:hypothetical protein D4764_12G0008310 [Takifugu flavidus]|uniref:Uncharacterized protein n=1 Tax=Takifugu flavidus TaxID=433684 RepID=A0A5C6PF37_9TELE|nr:hypothetical protein D4764_12G0008310 [Takifugu flavidus]